LPIAAPQAHPNPNPMPDRSFYTYIVASRSHTLYIGFTSNIEQRIWEHRASKRAY